MTDECFGQVIASRDSLRVRLCHKCGYAHLDPKPSEAEVAKYYQEDKFYTAFSPPDWIRSELNEHKLGYWNSRYAFESRFISKDYQLVDVGCGTGNFLAYWHYHGGFGYGIEPSRTCVKYSQIPGYIYLKAEELVQRLCYPVHLRYALVLEHLVNPGREILRLGGMVSPETRVLICVPNEFNPLQTKLRRKHGDWFVQGPHINYFTGLTLSRFMDNLGYKLEYKGATFPIELFGLLGKSYIGNPELGHKYHMRRLGFEQMLGPRAFEVYGLLHRKLGWGRELLYVFKQV